MPVPVEQFVKHLEDSGVLAGETLKDFIPPKADPKDAEELVRELLREKKLTRFQAEELWKGKGKSLVLGNYLLLDKIGEGGMGAVYKAEHRRMHRIVAIKMLPTAMNKDAVAIARFEREVTAAAQLRHPHIVAADDADEANGVHFLVMEYVDGSDLSALVKKNGPCSVMQAVNFILQAARGLEFAHNQGIIHRDIKPANLLLSFPPVRKSGAPSQSGDSTSSPHGPIVKILDMGLARIEQGLGPAQAELTGTGAIMGTVDYMPPEQAMDTRKADARADIYSLGCSLFYLLTGQSVYSGDTLMKRLLAHREQPIPSLRAIREEVPEQVEAIFWKMVAKNVADRYQTMTDVIADLEKCLKGGEPPAEPEQPFASFTDEGLTDFLKEISLGRTLPGRPERSPVRSRGGNRKEFLLIGGCVLGLLAVLAGLVLKFKTKEGGTLIVTVNEPDAEVQVLSEEGEVEITRKGEKSPLTIKVVPGKHQLKVTKEGFEFFTQEFSIGSGEKQPITAKLVAEDEGQKAPTRVATAMAPSDGERKAANWVLSVGGYVQVKALDETRYKVNHLNADESYAAVTVYKPDQFPVGGWQLRAIGITDNPGLTDADLKRISQVARLTSLVLERCPKLTDACVVHLKDLKFLAELRINGTSMTDKAIAELADLQFLTSVCTNAEQFSERTVNALKKFPRLVSIGISDDATDSQIELLVREFPELEHIAIASGRATSRGYALLSNLTRLRSLCANASTISDADLNALVELPLDLNILLYKTQVSDAAIPVLSRFTRLKQLTINETRLTSAGVAKLREALPDCEIISDYPEYRYPTKPTAAKKPLAFETPGFDQWVKEVAAMPADEQVKAVAKKLQELNPGFDGNVRHQILNGEVSLEFFADDVTDISPVRALPGLLYLKCHGIAASKDQLSDLSKAQLSDLSPLKGLQLRALDCAGTAVSDLLPLKGMPLHTLFCNQTLVTDLSPLTEMPLTALQCQRTQVSDLSPLGGMPMTYLNVSFTQVSSLSPLSGMSLTYMSCHGNNVTDLSLLNDMPIKELYCDFKPFRDTELLRSITTLETIQNKPATDFWKEVEAQQAAFEAWTKQVAALPAEQQVKAVAKKLQELNPGFDGTLTNVDGTGSPNIESGVVVHLALVSDNVTDISPLRALAGLKWLHCSGSAADRSRLSDLSPLRGMRLESLKFNFTHVENLSPLDRMPLVTLECMGTRVSDLSPLKNTPVKWLYLNFSKVADLSALQGMQLAAVCFQGTDVSDLSPLQGMKLVHFSCGGSKVSDLSPLKNMPLTHVGCDFQPDRDTELIRSLKSLEVINGKPAAEFWKEVEAKRKAE